MALIKCPECSNDVSDKAEKCPKCGYEFKKKGDSGSLELDKFIKNPNFKYVVVVIVALVVAFIVYTTSKNENNTPAPSPSNPTETQQPNQNGNYVFNQNGKYFEFPTTYRVYVDKDNTIYVGKNIDDKGALIPYIMIEKYKNYTDPLVLLNDVTTELNKAYGDVKILLNQLSGYVGDKLTYGSMFSYTSSGHLVIDNRYTFLVGNSMYLVTTKEENENSTEINNVCALIIKTLKEVN